MAYIVQDRLEITLFIDGTEYPIGNTNILDYLHIGASVGVRFPTLVLRITDVERVFDRVGLQDGSTINVTLREQNRDTRSFDFRVFGFKRRFNGSSHQYVIEAVVNNPLWVFGTVQGSLRGTSDSVLQQIANQCKLTYSGSATADPQLWLPQNATRSSWARTIAESGYVNDQSCMSLALDWDNVLRYRDVNNLTDNPTKIVAYQYAQDALTAVEVMEDANSGFSNAKTGYWDTRISQTTVNAAMSEQHKEISFTSDSRSPLFNAEVKRLAASGPVRFAPIDVGNTHPKSERATYQNIRYKNLFSLGLRLLLPLSSELKLYDRINLSVQKEDNSPDVGTSGVYTVTGHAILVQGLNYGEQLQVVRHGTNNLYNAR